MIDFQGPESESPKDHPEASDPHDPGPYDHYNEDWNYDYHPGLDDKFQDFTVHVHEQANLVGFPVRYDN